MVFGHIHCPIKYQYKRPIYRPCNVAIELSLTAYIMVEYKKIRYNLPIAKKQSIPTVKNIFSTNDGLDLASMILKTKHNENMISHNIKNTSFNHTP